MDQPEGFFFPLDPMQRPAVEAAEGVSLVTGGTGTGKTHVMVARVAYWLNEGVDPGHITCLAARGEAAADLRYRLGCHPRTWGHLDDIFVGTIHEYANVFLRRAGAAVLRRSPEYTIWDRRRAVEAVRIAWSDHYETGLRKRETEEALDWYWRNRSLLPISPPYPAMHGFWLDVEEVYKEEKRLQGAVDLVDLLVMAVGAMERDDDVRTEWRSTRSRHLLVDQVEDLTPRQLQLLELMVGPSRSLMVTTDLNQGIVMADPATTIELLRLNHQTWQRHVLRFDQVSSKELGEVASTLQRDAGHGRGLWDYGQVCDGVDGGAPVLVEVEGTLREMYSSCLDQAQRLADDGIPWKVLVLTKAPGAPRDRNDHLWPRAGAAPAVGRLKSSASGPVRPTLQAVFLGHGVQIELKDSHTRCGHRSPLAQLVPRHLNLHMVEAVDQRQALFYGCNQASHAENATRQHLHQYRSVIAYLYLRYQTKLVDIKPKVTTADSP